jgi:regulator of protease activity HflC (stomatin/prohibitin superfamily)
MKSATGFAMVFALIIAGFWLMWQWGFCRFYVAPNEMAVITAKAGDTLPSGQILAKRGEKGIQEEILGEGRHFLNPIQYERTILPVTIIPAGKVGVVTSKVGQELPEGEFLAAPGQKGIWRNVLGPGKYRLNPFGYTIDVLDAISVPIGYVGVVTSLSGEQASEGRFATTKQKGILSDILQPGLYYVNPREFKVDVLEIGVNQVSLLGKGGAAVITKGQIMTQNRAMDELQSKVLMEQKDKRAEYLLGENSMLQQTAPAAPMVAETRGRKPAPTPAGATFVLNQFVEFPSRDGFEISLDMTVEFELLPENIAWIFRSYGDLPAAVDKVIMPQILSISRLKGSAYGARDFIVGEGREKFQNDLTETLAKTLAEKKIVIHNALIRHVNVPMQILDPIQQASIAQEQDLTNKEKQNTAKKLAELNTEISLIAQKREQVAQETEKIRAEIKADQQKQVAEIGAEALKMVSEVEKRTASVRAEKVTKLGKAEADMVKLVDGERANGYHLRIKAFGDPAAFNLLCFATNLNPTVTVNILHAGPGTLWTDLQKANLGEMGGAAILQKTP